MLGHFLGIKGQVNSWENLSRQISPPTSHADHADRLAVNHWRRPTCKLIIDVVINFTTLVSSSCRITSCFAIIFTDLSLQQPDTYFIKRKLPETYFLNGKLPKTDIFNVKGIHIIHVLIYNTYGPICGRLKVFASVLLTRFGLEVRFFKENVCFNYLPSILILLKVWKETRWYETLF